MRTLVEAFKALSDETRLLMLGLLLQEGELCVCDFVEVLRITQSKASRHLRHLLNAGLVDDRRDGTWVYYRITDTPGPVQAHLIEALPAVLEERIPQGLFDRLAGWRKSKRLAGGSCKRIPAKRRAKKGGKR